MNPLIEPKIRPPSYMETERLILRRPRIEDAEIIFERWVADSEVTRYMCWTPHKSITETRAFLNRAITGWKEDTGELVYIIESKDTADIMGTVGLRPSTMKAELGYCLAKEYWNNGYMTEAVKALISWGLHDTRLQRLQATCDSDNIGSARVMEKSGMKKEATLDRYLYCPNIDRKRLRSAKLYAVTR